MKHLRDEMMSGNWSQSSGDEAAKPESDEAAKSDGSKKVQFEGKLTFLVLRLTVFLTEGGQMGINEKKNTFCLVVSKNKNDNNLECIS